MDSPRFHTVKITGGPSPTTVKVEIDGVPVKGLFALEIKCALNDVPRVKLEMYAALDTSMEGSWAVEEVGA